MIIERVDAVSGNIERFAHVYCLTMVVTRVAIDDRKLYRYYVSFKDVKNHD